ncbi:hypothetical protein IV203_015021 [Nitzschia inconspicua]|uniref:Uncharacterized protein n=1 Tax=Nitzschia inconspicua TaxID=303405 RepID=A0A9K3LAJ4_9STRA|nr:hypothetical protein IV203_015021 [Nitzschia inconspicua]
MMNIACITSYAEMERNLKNSIAFAKFGANTTDWTQACDVGSGFRTKKSKSRTTIAESCDEAFMTTFTRILESHYIHEAIVECVATAPRVHSHAWNQEKVQAAFIEVVFLDCVTKTCPDIFQMMSKCGVDFEKNRLRSMNRQMWQQSR